MVRRRAAIYGTGLAIGAALLFVVGAVITRMIFFSAINSGSNSVALSMLAINPSLIRAEDQYGSTALDLAVELSDVELVRQLLEKGADVHHESPRTGLPLHRAAFAGNKRLIETLLAAGADPNRNPRRSPAHDFGTALHFAVIGGSVDATRMLLEHGASVNSAATDHGGVTPLIVSVMNTRRPNERVELVRLLLDAGADINAADSLGNTALSVASSRAKSRDPKKAKLFEEIERLLKEAASASEWRKSS